MKHKVTETLWRSPEQELPKKTFKDCYIIDKTGGKIVKTEIPTRVIYLLQGTVYAGRYYSDGKERRWEGFATGQQPEWWAYQRDLGSAFDSHTLEEIYEKNMEE